MNYEKSIDKNYEYIVANAKKELAAPRANASYIASSLYALCSYFIACGKPAANEDELYSALRAELTEELLLSDANDAESIKTLCIAAKACTLYAKTAVCDQAEKFAKKLRAFLSERFLTSFDLNNNAELSESLVGALYSLADAADDEDLKLCEIAQKASQLLTCENYAFKDSFCAVNGAIGLVLISKRYPVLADDAQFSAKRIAALNANLDYTFNTSFKDDNALADPSVTSFALSLFVKAYKTYGDKFFLYMARRVWFNAMHFFQRNGGFVGYNNPPKAPVGILSVATYEEKTKTPLFAEGLCAYLLSKELFAEYDAPVKKDPRGRYLVGDKVFARELGEFFGRDLIEIPSLSSFDEEDAKNFKFKLLF